MSATRRDAPSQYLKYLPPVLWRDEAVNAPFTLAASLRIFEKVLTGIDDGVPLVHGENLGRQYLSLAAEIAAMHEVFDPWAAPATEDRDFLAWLASLVALRFPKLYKKNLWDEYQRRNATAKIAGIHRQRGLKTGLSGFLDLYAAGRVAPRVAIDDGARIIAVIPQRSAWARVGALVTQGPVLAADGSLRVEGLMRPQTVAVGPDGNIVAGEGPLPRGVRGAKSRVWRFSPDGQYRCSTLSPDVPEAELVATEPRRYPLAPGSLDVAEIRAVAVAPPRSGRPETVYVLEQSGRLTAVPAPYERTGGSPVPKATRIGTIGLPSVKLAPVAMVLDAATGSLLVLDRGTGPGTTNPPQIITVTVQPFTVTRTKLTTLVEPLALLVEPDGSLLIGDGGIQSPSTDDQLPGNIIRVDRSSSPWLEKPLLPPDNRLRAPTGIARTADGWLYVLDAGLKPFGVADDPFTRRVAEPATIFQVDEGGSTPRLTRIVPTGSFVYPVGMVASDERLLICDRGDYDPQSERPSWTRIKPFEFDVVIHWAEPRLPQDEKERHELLAGIVGDIRTVVEEQKPAHSVMNVVTRY